MIIVQYSEEPEVQDDGTVETKTTTSVTLRDVDLDAVKNAVQQFVDGGEDVTVSIKHKAPKE